MNLSLHPRDVTFELAQATETEKHQRDLQTYEAWGEPLTPDQFQTRESILRAQPWAQNCQKIWFLKNQTGQILASAETFEMKVWRDGQISQGLAIASVYTEPVLRGQGHASSLIRLLKARFEQTSSADAWILYSEVGEKLYEQLGFSVVPSYEYSLPSRIFQGNASLLTQDDCIQNFVELRNQIQFESGTWSIYPELDQLVWHWKRQEIYAKLLGRPIPQFMGARTSHGFLIWMADFKYRVLRILIESSTDHEDALNLYRVAQDFAFHLGLKEVRSWTNLSLQLQGVQEKRDDALTMVSLKGISPQQWRDIGRVGWV